MVFTRGGSPNRPIESVMLAAVFSPAVSVLPQISVNNIARSADEIKKT
jgi:hypothetical protein